MTTDYEWDDAVRALTERLRKLELAVARNKPAGGISYTDSGGFFGGGFPDLQTILDAIGAGTLPTGFLRTILGGLGEVQALGTLGATETIDLNNANLFWGTLDQDCTISFTGWTNLKDAQITVILYEDGTGGWTPTFSGVTWDGATPTHDTTPGTFTRYVFTSIDGGTTIIGAKTGDSGSTPTPLTVQEVDGSPTTSPDAIVVPNGSLEVVGTSALLRYIGSRAGGQQETQTIAASGAAQTLDLSLYNTFDITLTGNCTLTFSNPPASGVDAHWTIILRQGGVGSFTVTWPAAVDWQDPADGTTGGSAPTLWTAVGAQNDIEVSTLDGGTTYGGWFDSAAAAIALDDLTDVTLTTPASADRLRFDGSVWRNSAMIWRPVMAFDGTNWMVVVDGSGTAVMAEG